MSPVSRGPVNLKPSISCHILFLEGQRNLQSGAYHDWDNSQKTLALNPGMANKGYMVYHNCDRKIRKEPQNETSP